jgi:hypothetical protein
MSFKSQRSHPIIMIWEIFDLFGRIDIHMPER